MQWPSLGREPLWPEKLSCEEPQRPSTDWIIHDLVLAEFRPLKPQICREQSCCALGQNIRVDRTQLQERACVLDLICALEHLTAFCKGACFRRLGNPPFRYGTCYCSPLPHICGHPSDCYRKRLQTLGRAPATASTRAWSLWLTCRTSHGVLGQDLFNTNSTPAI